LVNVTKMVEKRGIALLIALCLIIVSPLSWQEVVAQPILEKSSDIICGAERTEMYLDLLKDRRVGLVANQSSRIGKIHLLDSLLALGVRVEGVFCPEHGFRGQEEAGKKFADQKDPLTGVRLISIYDKEKKPDPEDLEGFDVLLFDIQDVGARFYTYISSLHYVMEAAAEQGKDIIILDRPNPNGFYISGPIREDGFKSFVGMHPIPVVHGMTIGEYGLMVNEEGWLANSVKCSLKVIPCLNYDHLKLYELPVKPSPNLPNLESIILYPSLCFFEGTKVSIGRGTAIPFQLIGHPDMKGGFHFRPAPIPSASLHPKLEGKLCHGTDLRKTGTALVLKKRQLILEWLIQAYKELGSSDDFFTSYFDTLAGTSKLREQIINGWTADKIRASWATGIADFKKIRNKYLLYPDFE